MTYILISVVCGALSALLTTLTYRRYLHGRDTSPDLGRRLRLLVKVWEQTATSHRVRMTRHSCDDVAYRGHQEAWLAYSVCARRLGSVLQGEAAGGEQGLQEPVRRVEGGTPGEVVTAGADVTAEGVSVEVMSWPAPGAGTGPS